ncbi:translocation/assembly module TamB domain-containing protein [Sphaerotilus natans]|uniref:translocation/assembly module TamB domain-containing protein n=1 Tax=Sphaerotilus natans TaxID=34103 RepID=UPI00406C2B3F
MPDPTAQANSDSAAAAAVPVPPARPARSMLGRVLVVLLALLLLALAAGALLLSALKTEAGSRRLLSLVPGLQVEGLRGPLAGDLDIRTLSYPLGPTQTLRIDGLSWRLPVLDWPSGQAPALRLARLQIETIDLQGRAADSSPTVLPRSLVLPLSLQIDEIRIGRLMLDGLREQPLHDLSARLTLPAGPAGRHRLDAIALRRDQLQLRGQLEIGAAAPLPVQAQFSARAEAGTRSTAALPTDWQLDLGLSGPLARLDAKVKLLARGQALEAEAQLRPEQAQPLSRLQARLQEVDLAPLSSQLPQTALSGSIEARLEPGGTGSAGATSAGGRSAAPLQLQIDLLNRQPGRLDRQRLPLESLRIGATGDPSHPDIGTLETLRLVLHDGSGPAGTVLGKGRWSRSGPDSGSRLELALSATLQELQPARLDPRAPAMRLSGPLTLSWSQPPADRADQPPRATLQTDLRGRHERQDLPDLQLQLQMRGTPERIDLEKLRIGSDGARLQAEGRAERVDAGRRWQLQSRATLERFDPSLWWPGERQGTWQRGPHRLDGRMDLALGLPATPPASGDPGAWLAALDGQARLEIAPSLLAGVPLSGLLQIKGPPQGAGADRMLQAELDARVGAAPGPAGQAGATDLSLRGQLFPATAAPRRAGGEDRWQFTLRSGALQALQPWLRLAGSEARLAGEIDGSGTLQGRWPQLRLQARLDGRQLQLPDGLDLRQIGLRVDAGLRSATDPIELDLDLAGLDRPGLQLERLTLRGRGNPAAHRLELDSEMTASPARRLQARAVLEGNLTAGGRSWPPAPEAPLDWQGRLRDVALLGALPAALAPRNGKTDSSSNSSNTSPPALQPLLRLAELPLALQRQPDGRLSARAGAARLETLDARLALDQLEWQSAGPGSTDAPRLALQARLEPLALAPVLQKLQPDLGWSGDLTLDGRLDLQARDGRTTMSALLRRARGDLSLEDAELGTGPRRLGLGEIALQVQADGGLWQFSQRIDGSQLGHIEGRQTVRTTPDKMWPPAEAPLEGRLALEVAQLEHWGGWLPAGWRLSGRVGGQARLDGQFGQPRYAGELQGDRIAVRNVLEGIDWRDATLRASLDGDTARIERFAMRGGTGSLELSGQATLDARPVLTLRMTADRFAALQRIDRRASLSGRADLRVDAAETRLQGALKVDEGRFDFSQSDAPSLGDDVDVDRGRGANRPRETAARGSPRDTALDLRVDLGERFQLVGRGLSTRLTGELRLSSPANRLAVNGSIRAVDGTYAAYGQKLRVERSVISFTGLPDNPRLDIEAIRPDLEDVRVGISVTGTAQLPRIRLISEPSMSDTDRLSWLILGRASDGLGRTDMALLQRAATALIAGESDAPSLVERIGLDQFSVRQDGEGDSRETVVTLGKQISQRWYVGYERSLNAASGTWQLIYRAARRFTLRAQSGAENALDLIWTWQWGSGSLLPPIGQPAEPAKDKAPAR